MSNDMLKKLFIETHCKVCKKYMVLSNRALYTYKRKNNKGRFVYYCSWTCYRKGN